MEFASVSPSQFEFFCSFLRAIFAHFFAEFAQNSFRRNFTFCAEYDDKNLAQNAEICAFFSIPLETLVELLENCQEIAIVLVPNVDKLSEIKFD